MAAATLSATPAVAGGVPAAELELRDPDGGRSMGESSTYTDRTFRLTNTGDVAITGLRVDLRPALLPDLVFDPDGTAGDDVGRGLTVNHPGEPGASLSAPVSDVPPPAPGDVVYLSPHDGGFDVVDAQLSGADPGDVLVFGIDVDPTSTRGASGAAGLTPPAAHVSGTELAGAEVTVRFADGTVTTSDLTVTPRALAGANWERAARAALVPGRPETPGLVLPGAPLAGVVRDPAQRVVVTGPPGARGAVVVAEAHLNVARVPGGGHDLDPGEVNMAARFSEQAVTLDAAGRAEVTVALTRTTPHPDFPDPGDAPRLVGVNVVTAHLVDGAGRPGRSSPRTVVVLDPAAPAPGTPPSPPAPGGPAAPAAPPAPPGSGAGDPEPARTAAAIPAAPRCAASPPPRPRSRDGRVRLTAAQLTVNRRIAQAALRRARAVEAWLEAGVTAGDLCGGSVTARDLGPGITTGTTAVATPVPAAAPRPLTPRRPRARARGVTLSAAEMLRSQRIAQAAIRALNRVDARLDAGLTGRDVRDGAITPDRLAPGLTARPAAGPLTPPSGPAGDAARPRGTRTDPSGVRLTARQLRINQRISAAAVRRANRLEDRLARGLTGEDIRDGSLGPADLAGG